MFMKWGRLHAAPSFFGVAGERVKASSAVSRSNIVKSI